MGGCCCACVRCRYRDYAARTRASLQRVSFEVGFEKSTLKGKDAGQPKLHISPERHESLSGLLNGWQEQLAEYVTCFVGGIGGFRTDHTASSQYTGWLTRECVCVCMLSLIHI